MKWKTSGGNDEFLGKTYVARQRRGVREEVIGRTSWRRTLSTIAMTGMLMNARSARRDAESGRYL
jgi:hypothetical protein